MDLVLWFLVGGLYSLVVYKQILAFRESRIPNDTMLHGTILHDTRQAGHIEGFNKGFARGEAAGFKKAAQHSEASYKDGLKHAYQDAADLVARAISNHTDARCFVTCGILAPLRDLFAEKARK